MTRLLFLVFSGAAFLSGCGEAVFYKDIRLRESPSAVDLRRLIASAAHELGYVPSAENENGYINKAAYRYFEVSRDTGTEFEVTFESFGVPNRQGTATEELAATMRRQCGECQIHIKERSVWGFLKEDSGWKPF